MTLKHLQKWAQSQIDNTAQPEIRPDIGITVLQLVDELEELKNLVNQLEEKLNELNPEGIEVINPKAAMNTVQSVLDSIDRAENASL